MPGTINRELAVLRAALMLGARHTRPKVDRVPYIPQLRGNNPRQGFFEHEEYGAVLSQLPEYLRPVVTFAYHTGWRKEEVLSLTSAQVDRMQGTVRLNRGMRKNREGRTVYLDDEVKGVIEDQWARRNRTGTGLPWVLLNATGTDRIGVFFEVWNNACKAAGYPGRLFYDLRRKACRDMVHSGVPERVAMMVSVHKTRGVFDRYNIVSDADLKLAAAKQEAYLQTVTGKVTPLPPPSNSPNHPRLCVSRFRMLSFIYLSVFLMLNS